MNFIVFDLEATCWENRPPGMVQETIEIGAFCLNRYGEVVAEYNRFIKPILNPYLSPFCMELTSITQEEVDRAKIFPEVIEEFQDWAEIFDTEYLLCSWGKYDKELLTQDCQLHHIEPDWLEHHINVKHQYREIKRLKKAIGLKAAVKKEGFEFSGIHHRGIDDAHNLVKIFTKYLDMWRY